MLRLRFFPSLRRPAPIASSVTLVLNRVQYLRPPVFGHWWVGMAGSPKSVVLNRFYNLTVRHIAVLRLSEVAALRGCVPKVPQKSTAFERDARLFLIPQPICLVVGDVITPMLLSSYIDVDCIARARVRQLAHSATLPRLARSFYVVKPVLILRWWNKSA